jgi:hypothetical protein
MATAPEPPATTAQTASTPAAPPRAGAATTRITPGWRARVPAIAGIAYLAAWVAGLAAWPVNLALDASAAQVATAFRQHPAEAVVQLLLVEGLAGILLGVVLAAALVGRREQIARRPVAAVAGAVAVAASVAQCVLGLILTASAVGNDVSGSGSLGALVNRLDGVKMLALAAVAIWLAAAPAWPRWLRVISVLLAVAVVTSGYAYVALANTLAWTAYVSGPLLLAWVTSLGIWLTATRRPHSDQHRAARSAESEA